ncbi:MAG: serine hydrolase [Enhydrobacter sp.]
MFGRAVHRFDTGRGQAFFQFRRGQRFDEFLSARIFTPLGMTNTMLAADIATVIPDLATGYLGSAEQGFRRAAHGYPQGGEGGLTSTVEDLFIWSRHYDEPVLGKTLPAQLTAAAPLTGGHHNRYHRGVTVGNFRGLATVSHGGLWPGFRTHFLRVPAAGLTVVVIANLDSIDPQRLSHTIAGEALAGDRRLKPALPPITQDEIKPIAGTWFNAAEPSLFDLAWKNGEATVTQNGQSFTIFRLPGGWFGPEHGLTELMLKPVKGGLRVDLGAGRVMTFKKVTKRKAVPAAIAGIFSSPDTGATWHIRRGGADYTIAVYGPLVSGGAAWTVIGIDADTVEIVSPGSWFKPTQLAHLKRDKAGKITALVVSTGRLKNVRFERTG